jgi:erythronate-4-phosphate dehydrogenase
MRILVDENIPQGDTAFAPYGEVVRFHGRQLVAADLKGCRALIVRSITRVNAALLDESAGSEVGFVGTATIGTDHVDQAYLARRGIAFASAPGCNAKSVGDYVTAALLELHASAGLELDGATLGIVGYGHVGKQVKLRAEALGISSGLKVMLCDPPLQEQGMDAVLGVTFHDLGTLLRECDVISLHVPLTRQGPHATLNMLNEAVLASVAGERGQRPLTVVNTCRGEVAEAAALIAGKRTGLLPRLVLDVFPGEPNPDAALWRACDLATPHIAGYSLQGKLGGTQQVLEAFCRHFGFAAPGQREEPAPEHPVIDLTVLPREASLFEVARFAVRHAYDLRGDDARLRQALSGNEPAKGFDRLRRDYPIRHEFTRFKVAGHASHDPKTISTLVGLGFGVL